MKTLQILGTGCPKCNQLAASTDLAATALGLDFQIEKVSDLKRIMSFGVMATPALVVDGVVKCVGRVPKMDELKTMLV
jgi:small redox-active disulfide protein 2